MFCLIDGSRFYCSASTIMHPDLRDKPVLVASGLDGISIAASRACTEKGIPKFSPIFEVKDKLAMFDGVIFKANFNTLGHISHRMMASITEAIGSDLPYYQYSVDEMFIDVTRLHAMGVDLNEHLLVARKQIYKETRIGTGGGVGRTLTLSKVASFAGKKLPDYKGQCVLDSEQSENKVLKLMPLGDVWNIGKRLTEHLKFKGITTAYQLKNANAKQLQKEFSINVANVVHELNGVPVLNFTDKPPAKKQIFSTSSSRNRLRSIEEVTTVIANHAAEVCKKARAQNSDAKALQVFVSTSPYDKCPRHSKSAEVTFDSATSDTSIVLKTVREMLYEILPRCLLTQPLYKVGVGATKLINSEMRQLDMFQENKDNVRLMKALDGLNARFGKGSVSFASQQTTALKTKGNLELLELSNYLTNYNQIVEIKCI
ncbi:Y-family DNA polymerase [Vibrio sp. D431a]|uniref:Y-family DNA polymerase n=1 Tax=Vibrio sp. D431a TaxID=2837388 RepID=UPI00255372C5|nr:Y-family DNA polymerase [Vibrio sp. D431a]MDK9790109.1 Y-family DNA polymerase [Vibrio sp. D431a]